MMRSSNAITGMSAAGDWLVGVRSPRSRLRGPGAAPSPNFPRAALLTCPASEAWWFTTALSL